MPALFLSLRAAIGGVAIRTPPREGTEPLPYKSIVPSHSVGAGLCARPFPVIASRHRRRSNPYSRGNPSLRSVPGDSFALPSARHFCHQRQKYPKTPLRNYVSKDFLSRYAHPCSNHSPRDCGKAGKYRTKGELPVRLYSLIRCTPRAFALAAAHSSRARAGTLCSIEGTPASTVG